LTGRGDMVSCPVFQEIELIRSAKTCVQTSDWLQHEVTVHLTNTHLIEEATIVGVQWSFPDKHPVFQLLYPHWQKTLALNAAARGTLVPHVINELIGFTKEQSTRFTLHAFNSFDFQGRYAPEDLRRRGFPPETLNDARSRNYAWARCIHSMWGKIRRYVEGMLSLEYPQPNADRDVARDPCIRDWCEIMQKDPAFKDGGAGLKSFPTIRTFDQLVDAVTMCIHIASPQHTSINYLQNYYQAFVINKPPCLYTPPPVSRAELMAYKEKEFVLALPLNHPKEWLLASHIPYLLSFKPGDRESLIQYACSKYNVYKAKRRGDDKHAPEIAEYARKFYTELADSELEFRKFSQDTFDSSVITYDVLSPSWNAVSILI
jgi:Lipoxygenase